MVKGGMRLHAERPVEDVFDFLADLRNEKLWNPRVRQLTLATPGPIAAGSVFRGEYQGLGTLVTTLTEYDRPNRIGFRSEGQRAHLEGVFTIGKTGQGADVALGRHRAAPRVAGTSRPDDEPRISTTERGRGRATDAGTRARPSMTHGPRRGRPQPTQRRPCSRHGQTEVSRV
jgi:hypothetical protein